jgi:hypothetical protein
MMGNTAPGYAKVRQEFPGMVEAVFVPAVRDGKWMPGAYAYRFEVPR